MAFKYFIENQNQHYRFTDYKLVMTQSKKNSTFFSEIFVFVAFNNYGIMDYCIMV